MRIGIGADHGGFEMKEHLARKLALEGHEVIDFGNRVLDSAGDYPDFGIPFSRALRADTYSGVSCCAAAEWARPWLPTKCMARARRSATMIFRRARG